MPLSARYGRAFEFCVTKSILSQLEELYPGKVKTTERAKGMQRQGREQFENLNVELREQFTGSGRKIAGWLSENKLKEIGETSRVELDRIPDIAGTMGDVTDIRAQFFTKDGVRYVNVSLKHRHEALKHPRLTRVPEWIGLAESGQGRKYIDAYERIWSTFFQRGKKLSPNAKRFRELRAIDHTFVERNLYVPLYTLVRNFLQENVKTSSEVRQMFDFLVGKFDFVKFVDHDGGIEIRDFSNILRPSRVEIEYEGTGYLHVNFDNGWRLSARLHTATEWLKKSIKFDVQPMDLDSVVPAIYI